VSFTVFSRTFGGTEDILKANVKHALEQANLLSGVRNDIECVSVFSVSFPNSDLLMDLSARINLQLLIHSWQSGVG
jgi:hypothetical protein